MRKICQNTKILLLLILVELSYYDSTSWLGMRRSEAAITAPNPLGRAEAVRNSLCNSCPKRFFTRDGNTLTGYQPLNYTPIVVTDEYPVHISLCHLGSVLQIDLEEEVNQDYGIRVYASDSPMPISVRHTHIGRVNKMHVCDEAAWPPGFEAQISAIVLGIFQKGVFLGEITLMEPIFKKIQVRNASSLANRGRILQQMGVIGADVHSLLTVTND